MCGDMSENIYTSLTILFQDHSKSRGEFMKDEGVMESQVYTHESLDLR